MNHELNSPEENKVESQPNNTPDAEWQKAVDFMHTKPNYKEMNEFFKKTIDGTTENITKETAPGYKSKVTIAAKDDRVLPKNFMPDEAKEAEYLERIGKPLPAVLYKRETRERIALPANAGVIYRQLIRVSKAGYVGLENKDIRDKRAKDIQGLLMKRVLPGLDQKDREKLQSGDWSVRSETTQVEYERLAGSVFRELEQGEDDVKNVATIAEESGMIADQNELREAAKMIDFRKHLDLKGFINNMIESDIEVVTTPEIKLPTTKSRHENKLEARKRNRQPNDLQILLTKIHKAVQEGDWDSVAEDYTKLVTHLPTYISHNWANIDLMKRFKKGEIKELPKNILSLGSGPYIEAIAQENFLEIYENLNLKPPHIIHVDRSKKMLIKGKAVASEELKTSAIKGTMLTEKSDENFLPLKNESVDLTQSSSLNALKSAKDISMTIKEMTRVTKNGGFMRIVYQHPVPEVFYKELGDLGWEVQTSHGTKFNIPDAIKKFVKGTNSEELFKRAQIKVKPLYYVFARKVRNVNISEVEDFNFELPKEDAEIKAEITEMSILKPETQRPRGKRIDWNRSGLDLSVEDLQQELQRREKEFESVIRNDDMNEAKNLFWEFGRAGRESNITSGDVGIESAEALPTSILLKRAGSRRFKNTLDALRRKIWPEKPKFRQEEDLVEIPAEILGKPKDQ